MAEKIKEYSDRIQTFDILNAVNVNEHTEVKDTGKVKLTYLSWAWAWAEVKKRFPEARYEIIKFNGLPYVYDEKTGYMVYTTVTIDEITHEMWLPVMDGNNRAMMAQPYEVKTKYNSITVQPATMFDVNKAIMRCLTKNLAMFGLGLYIYAGEDLPESSDDEIVKAEAKPAKKKAPEKKAETAEEAHQRAKEAYQALINYCKQTKRDINAVAQTYKLNAKSTAGEFSFAIEDLRKADELANELPYELPYEQ